MAMYEWLTVAAIASTIFAVMMIVIQTRRARHKRNEARRNHYARRKSNRKGSIRTIIMAGDDTHLSKWKKD